MTAAADACVIGAGAAGPVAAKVLAKHGCRVIILEKGPWLSAGQFAADEVGTINRELLKPDPLLEPRTVRQNASEQARATQFCSLPQMVGGGTVHWTGFTLRLLRQDLLMRSLFGQVAGASLADWPIAYEELEPGYDAVERTLGVSGRRAANRFEEPRSSEYPCPPLPISRYAERFSMGCAALGWNSFPTPVALRSRPHAGRPPAKLHPFIERHGDPTGSKGSTLYTFVPDAVATGLVDLRPRCRVVELEHRDGRVTAAIYQDGDGRRHRQAADIFLLACGAIESARLWQLSGLPDPNDLVGRYLTLHEFVMATGQFDEPVYGWEGGGHLSASTFEFYRSDISRGFIGGTHILCTGPRMPWPVNFTLPGRPLWGGEMKKADRETFNHVMSVGLVLSDVPQHCNRVDLDPAVSDAWGQPVARITHQTHANDLAQGSWMLARSVEILEAAGASRVWRFPMERITGNASHQHGTLRMGEDPSESVLNRWCQAWDVQNLFAIDGSPFPTPAGNNPTLTIMANAWRVSEAIVSRAPRGDGIPYA